jgi:O-succinylbenzoate synthase
MSLLTGDVTADPLVPVNGELPVMRPRIDTERLARFETDPRPWRDRALAAAPFLDEVRMGTPGPAGTGAPGGRSVGQP